MLVFMALSYEVNHMGILYIPPRINVKTSIQGKCFAHFMLYCRMQLASYLIVEYAIFFLILFQVLCNLCYLAGRWKIHCTDADVIFFMDLKKKLHIIMHLL